MTSVAPLALVTGASGFVGSHLVEGLVRDGWRVRCLLRPQSERRWLPATNVAVAVGSMDDVPSLVDAVAGVDVVFHLAAVTSASRPADYDRVNYGGVVRLLDALSSRAPAAYLVFCSSLAAGGPAEGGRVLTERDPPRPMGPYGASKARAEEAVGAWAGRAVSIRPSAVYGPRDRDILAAFRLARYGLAIRTGPPGQQLALVHVYDLVRGLIAAARADHARGVYYLNGDNVAWGAIVGAIGAAMGRRLRIVPLPRVALVGAAVASRAWSKVAGAKPLLTPERARDLMQAAWTCDDARARRELGYQPRITLEDGMRETAAWYRAAGWL